MQKMLIPITENIEFYSKSHIAYLITSYMEEYTAKKGNFLRRIVVFERIRNLNYMEILLILSKRPTQ